MRRSFFFLLALVTCTSPLVAKIEKHLQPPESDQVAFNAARACMEEGKWADSVRHFQTLTTYCPYSPLFSEAVYQCALCYMQLEEYEYSNQQLTNYLNLPDPSQHFMEALQYKFLIAEGFAAGGKRHLFGWGGLPRWGSSASLAIEIYEELIATLPGSEMAKKSLYSKGVLQTAKKQYDDAIVSFEQLIRRYPKDAAAIESFRMISSIYLTKAKADAQNPDLIGLAEVNLRKFTKSFPSEPHIGEVEANLSAMRECFARSLYQTGKFYERKGKPHSSKIYYEHTVHLYPTTEAAQRCQERLSALS